MSAAVLAAGVAAACAGAAAGEAVLLARGRRAARRGGGRRHRRGRLPGALARLAPRLGMAGPPGDLGARMAAADLPAWATVGALMTLKWGLGAGGAAVGLLTGPLLPGRLGVLVLVAAPACGFLAPDLVLVRRARRRARAARAEAADLLDRVRLVADAGLSPRAALERAARDGGGPLAAELRTLAALGEFGAPREDGLRRMTERLPIPEAHALAAAVRRAERHGTSLGPAVAALAAGARADRARRVRDRAQRAAPKIQLVVALLLVPAVLLLVAAGLLVGLR